MDDFYCVQHFPHHIILCFSFNELRNWDSYFWKCHALHPWYYKFLTFPAPVLTLSDYEEWIVNFSARFIVNCFEEEIKSSFSFFFYFMTFTRKLEYERQTYWQLLHLAMVSRFLFQFTESIAFPSHPNFSYFIKLTSNFGDKYLKKEFVYCLLLIAVLLYFLKTEGT